MLEREKIIDANDGKSFNTIYEAINWCVGTGYTYWGRACWPQVRPKDRGFRLWFTQLAYVRHGELVPAASDCLNMICSDGNYFIFDYVGPKKVSTMNRDNWECDLIFTKSLGGDYVFRGIYVRDYDHSSPNHYVSRRIGTKARLIGCPARHIELLDNCDITDYPKDYLRDYQLTCARSGISTSNKRQANKAPIVMKKPIAVEEPLKLSDEECKKMFPIDSRVRHKKFGTGVVQSINAGKVTIVFDASGTKLLEVDFCVKNDLLSKE